ncbi:MAG: nuclear transport factor 2 family protein [Gammaproteobacteria bacterium]|tara:strand:- start:76 stop:492 length:417 start_codon:yes stop_codon:yes gene_type:complete
MDHRTRIESYFNACSAGTAAEIASQFTSDAVIYDTNHRPLKTAAEIGSVWEKVRNQWQNARWYVDSCLSVGDAAAIEWTMTGVHESAGAFTVRGSEHYRFEDGLIAEIRQYWTFDRDKPGSALVDFPYAERDNFHQAG